MSQANVELARRAVEHFMQTGEHAWELIDEEVEVHDHDILDAREYRGHAGWARWFEDWGAAWAEYSVEPEEFIDADGDRVILVLRLYATGRGSGVKVERQDAMVITVRDGKIARVDYYTASSRASNLWGSRNRRCRRTSTSCASSYAAWERGDRAVRSLRELLLLRWLDVDVLDRDRRRETGCCTVLVGQLGDRPAELHPAPRRWCGGADAMMELNSRVGQRGGLIPGRGVVVGLGHLDLERAAVALRTPDDPAAVTLAWVRLGS
jgi:ketosteroid isomerase-like protein